MWPNVLGRIFTMRRVTWTFLSQHAQILDYDGTRLVLGIATTGLANTFRQGNHAELVRQALIDEIGLDVRVDGVPIPPSGASPEPPQAPPARIGPPPTRAPSGAGDPGWPEPPPVDEPPPPEDEPPHDVPAAQAPAPPAPEQSTASDAMAAWDDEDVDGADEIGQVVIERLLGGTVLEDPST